MFPDSTSCSMSSARATVRVWGGRALEYAFNGKHKLRLYKLNSASAATGRISVAISLQNAISRGLELETILAIFVALFAVLALIRSR